MDAESVAGPATDLATGHPEDARLAGAKHLDTRTGAQAKFLEPMHMVGITRDAAHSGVLPGRQLGQRNGLVDHDATLKL